MMLGGMIPDSDPAAAATAPASGALKPCFSSSGTATWPSEAAVAVPDPETAPSIAPAIRVSDPRTPLRPRENLLTT